jgi:hypothetical protein
MCILYWLTYKLKNGISECKISILCRNLIHSLPAHTVVPYSVHNGMVFAISGDPLCVYLTPTPNLLKLCSVCVYIQIWAVTLVRSFHKEINFLLQPLIVTLFVAVLFGFEYWVSLVQKGYESLIRESSLETRAFKQKWYICKIVLFMQRVLWLYVNIQAVISEIFQVTNLM